MCKVKQYKTLKGFDWWYVTEVRIFGILVFVKEVKIS